MRNYTSPKKFIVLFFLLIALAALFPWLLRGLDGISPRIRYAGEKAALASAFFDMPDRTLALLQTRFRSDMYSEKDDKPSPTEPPEPTPAKKPEKTPAPSATASASPEPEPEKTEPPPKATSEKAPDIPEKYRGLLLDEDFSGNEKSGFLDLSPGYLRNYTDLAYSEIRKALDGESGISLGDAAAPQVLIYHTHATESFESYDSKYYDTRNSWRSTDNNKNMVAVGEALAESLRAGGINVLHDTTQHDYPSYNGAYDRSAETVRGYLEEYPSIEIIFDVHRDAIDRDGVLVRPVSTINGEKAAQLMIIAGCDDGTMNMPNWRKNLRFAADIQRQTESDYESLMRPIFFCYRKYNLDMLPGSLLLEFGSHGNTLEECLVTARLAGESIAKTINGMK